MPGGDGCSLRARHHVRRAAAHGARHRSHQAARRRGASDGGAALRQLAARNRWGQGGAASRCALGCRRQRRRARSSNEADGSYKSGHGLHAAGSVGKFRTVAPRIISMKWQRRRPQRAAPSETVAGACCAVVASIQQPQPPMLARRALASATRCASVREAARRAALPARPLPQSWAPLKRGCAAAAAAAQPQPPRTGPAHWAAVYAQLSKFRLRRAPAARARSWR